MKVFHRLSRFGSTVTGRTSLVRKSAMVHLARGWRWLMPRRRMAFGAAGISIVVVLLIGFASAKGVLWQVGIGIAAVIVVVGVALLWWCVPKWQMRSVTTGDPKARADIEDNFRKTVGQALGGIAVLIGAGMAYYGTQQTLQVNEGQSRLSLQASHDLLISQQVAKGFEQLGSDKMVLRLGGIYALEGVMNGSEQYHQPVLEALCAFVRDGTKTHDGKNDPPATDIQAALTVIGRRGPGDGIVDLTSVHIPKANLERTDLSGANLTEANLSTAHLNGANLSGARLFGANLSGARLVGANLYFADLHGADLRGADLKVADLRYADLRGALISQSELAEACTADQDAREPAEAKLPPGLTLRQCDFSPPGGGEF